jgi:hypothetical protein
LGCRPAFAPEPRLIRFSPVVTTHLAAGRDSVPSPPTPEKVRALLGRLTRIPAAPKMLTPVFQCPAGSQVQTSGKIVNRDWASVLLRSNDLIGTTPQGFELGQALSEARG